MILRIRILDFLFSFHFLQRLSTNIVFSFIFKKLRGRIPVVIHRIRLPAWMHLGCTSHPIRRGLASCFFAWWMFCKSDSQMFPYQPIDHAFRHTQY